VLVEITVHYDGPDCEEVAELTDLTPDELVAAHTGSSWRVAFAGFPPGFAYLARGDPRLQVPRRSEPRTSVAAGSVGPAGSSARFTHAPHREDGDCWHTPARS
jgi:allophanate hydrolase subunit 1